MTLHFQSQPGNSEEQHVLEQQQELNFRASIQDSTGLSSPVVYTLEGVGVSEREAILAIKSQLYDVEKCAEKERSTLNAEIETLKAEKLNVEQKLADVSDQLYQSLDEGRTKDEQLNAQEEEMKAKDKELKLQESKLSDLAKELQTKLAAKEKELNNNVQKLQKQKFELEKQLSEKIAELEKQKEVTETLRKEKEASELTLKHERAVSSLEIKMRDQQIEHSKDKQQMKDRQHELELQIATKNGMYSYRIARVTLSNIKFGEMALHWYWCNLVIRTLTAIGTHALS
jgi:DNA repair exonuclease SbcCD ATPase subunit